MSHRLLRDASFWLFLFAVDQDLARTEHERGCCCGARLHRADFPRKPRGGPDRLPVEVCYRLSFCCSREGCRKRSTPPSVRFLGRTVYLGAVVLLTTAMRQGPTPRGLGELRRLFGVDRRTLARWRVFWLERFPGSRFWKIGRARFQQPVDVATLPLSLLDAFLRGRDFVEDERDGWRRLLLFLSPISSGRRDSIELVR